MAMIGIIKTVDFWDLQKELWCGAVYTAKTIIENEKTYEFMQLLEEVFYDEPTDIMKINDFLWFDEDFIYEQLSIEAED